MTKLISKKRGRPFGSKNKPSKVGTVKTFKQLNASASRIAKQQREQELLNEHINLLIELGNFKKQVDNLEHQAIGYRAVVSYLENQLGLKGTQ